MNYARLKGDVMEKLAGGRGRVNSYTFQNDYVWLKSLSKCSRILSEFYLLLRILSNN
mgnify:FL=1